MCHIYFQMRYRKLRQDFVTVDMTPSKVIRSGCWWFILGTSIYWLKVHPLVISHSYWTWPIDCLSIKHGDFPVRYVNVYQRLHQNFRGVVIWSSTWFIYSMIGNPMFVTWVSPCLSSWCPSVVLPSGHRTPSRHAMHWRSMSCPRMMMDSMDCLWIVFFFFSGKSMEINGCFESVFIIKYVHVINKFLSKRSLQAILWKWETCGSRYKPVDLRI